MALPKRRSEHLTRKQASTLMAAARFAQKIGRPLNVMVTLNLRHTPCDPSRISEIFERLRDHHFTRWMRYQSELAKKARRSTFGPSTYCWVIEMKADCPNVHWNVHIPAGLRHAFEAKLPQWLTKVAGMIDSPRAIHTQSIYGPNGLMRYCSKGIHPSAAEAKHIRPEPQGIVLGKRSGTSKNLGPFARKWHGVTATRSARSSAGRPAAPPM